MLRLRIGLAVFAGIVFVLLGFAAKHSIDLIPVFYSPPSYVLILSLVSAYLFLTPKYSHQTFSDRLVVSILNTAPWIFILGCTLPYMKLFKHLDSPELMGPPIMVQFALILIVSTLVGLVALPMKFRMDMRDQPEVEPENVLANSLPAGFSFRYLVGVVVFLVFLVLMLVLKHATDLITTFIFSPPAWSLFLGCSLGLPFIALDKGAFRAAAKALFTRQTISDSEALAIWNLAKVLKQSFILAGMLGLTIGVARVLFLMENPDSIGPGLMVALVSVVYAVVLYILIALPLEYRVSVLKTKGDAHE